NGLRKRWDFGKRPRPLNALISTPIRWRVSVIRSPVSLNKQSIEAEERLMNPVEKRSAAIDVPENPQTETPLAPPRPERRSRPRELPKSIFTPPTPPPPPHLDDYENIIGKAQVDALRFLAHELKGKTVKMVNSTAVGGGVAEMLNRLVPLLSELEVGTNWDVITGGNDFFEVTKAFHNALHGTPYDLTQGARDIFLMYNEQNRKRMQFNE